MEELLARSKRWVRGNRLTQLILLAREYLCDFRRFVRHSASFRLDTRDKLKAKIVRQCHIIEKGLALREPRITLSRFRARTLMADIDVFISNYGWHPLVEDVVVALRHFARFLQEENMMSADGVSAEELLELVAALETRCELSTQIGSLGPIKTVTREAVHEMGKRDLTAFFSSRHSVRRFDDRRVDDALIEQAVEMATHTPSACNRQPWKVYAVREPRLKRRALALQGGNAGFGDQADVVLVVTGNVSATLRPGERMQPWLDGGMFAMSLVYSLHSLGLGNCCLNWAKSRGVSRELHQLLGIPENEVVLMLIAVGHLPEKFEVASSRRYPITDVLVKVE